MLLRAALLTVSLVATAMAPASASAQRSLSVGMAGGLTPTPNGSIRSTYETGAHVQLSVERARVLGRIGLRADAFVHGFQRETFGGDRARQTSIPGASASLVLPLSAAGARLRPYLLAGGGTYRTDLGGGSPEWHFGWSGGGGLELGLGPLRPFIEARLHRVADGGTPRLVPVSIGLRF